MRLFTPRYLPLIVSAAVFVSSLGVALQEGRLWWPPAAPWR